MSAGGTMPLTSLQLEKWVLRRFVKTAEVSREVLRMLLSFAPRGSQERLMAINSC